MPEHDHDWELAPENAHPRAGQLLTEPFFWSIADDDAPLGNDTGADTLAFYRQWRSKHPTTGVQVFNKQTMKTSHRVGLLIVSVFASALFMGCASVSLPAARSYSVQIGNNEYHAKSVKFHGQWIEIETETGTVWAKNSAVTIKANK